MGAADDATRRDAVWDVALAGDPAGNGGGWFSTDDVVAAVEDLSWSPSVSQATARRTLKVMCERGFLKQRGTGDKTWAYEFKSNVYGSARLRRER